MAMVRYTQNDLGNYSIDVANGAIKGVALASIGEAIGHESYFDSHTISQIADSLNAAKNKRIKARFGHPPAHEDPLGTQIGYFVNARVSGDKVIADFVATPTPHNDSLIKHIFALAESGADLFGISIEAVVDYAKKDGDEKNYVRVTQLEAAAFVSDPAANADGLFNAQLQTPKSKKMEKKEPWLIKAFKRAFAQFAEAELPDGTVIRFPGDSPAIGDPVMIIENGEEVGAAPDGNHQVGGLIVRTEGGMIVAISMADQTDTEAKASPETVQADAIPEQIEASQSTERQKVANYSAPKQVPKTPEKVKTENELNLEKKVAAMEAAFAKLAGQPAESFNLETANFAIGSGAIKRGDAIIDGFKELQHLKKQSFESGEAIKTRKMTYAERKQFQFNPDPALTPALQDFVDPMADFVYQSPLEAYFVFDKADVGRNASTTKTLPTIYDDNGGTSRLTPGQSCIPDPQGQTTSSGRDVVVNPWSYFREYCTRNADFATYLDRLRVVSVDSIPFEAMILDALLNQLSNDWALDVYLGGVSLGLLPQLIADANVVGSPANANPSTYTAANFAITGANVVTEMESIAVDLPARIRQMQSQFDLQWMGYADHIESYLYARGEGIAANAPLSELIKPPLLSQARFAPDWNLQDPAAGPPPEFYMVVTPRDNLRIYTSAQDSGLFSVRPYFDPRTSILSFNHEGHLGVGYAQSENVFMSVGS